MSICVFARANKLRLLAVEMCSMLISKLDYYDCTKLYCVSGKRMQIITLFLLCTFVDTSLHRNYVSIVRNILKNHMEKKGPKTLEKGTHFPRFLDPFGRFFSSRFSKKKVWGHFLIDILCCLNILNKISKIEEKKTYCHFKYINKQSVLKLNVVSKTSPPHLNYSFCIVVMVVQSSAHQYLAIQGTCPLLPGK